MGDLLQFRPAPKLGKGERPRRAKCTYADRYQAKRAPICGCQVCAEKWAARTDADRLRDLDRKEPNGPRGMTIEEFFATPAESLIDFAKQGEPPKESA